MTRPPGRPERPPAAAWFGPGGSLARAHPSYEHRPGQERMAEAVERVLGDGGSLLVEAGTGTGKTLAYLLPALLSGRPVIVSTGTRNLQDQIFLQDLPLLRERLGLRFRATRMKGRANYLCRYRLAELERQPLIEDLAERDWLPRIAAWSRETATGDRAELADMPDALRLWNDVSARSETCTGRRCPEFESCWLTRMKREAEQSDVVVVNHHLFFADLAVRSAYGAVLPEYDTVVFDEAHLLEDVATLYFGVHVSSRQVHEVARDAERAAAERQVAGDGGAAELRAAAQEFFLPFRERLEREPGRVRFDPPRLGGLRLDVEAAALVAALDAVARQAGSLDDEGSAAESLGRRTVELREDLERVLHREDPDFVYGMELRGRGLVTLGASPIDVSGELRSSLFERLRACVLTSATLAVGGRFDLFVGRLGLEGAEGLIVESPFAYDEQAVLLLAPPAMPEPREREFAARCAEAIERLLEITRGRAFLLFTSWANMHRVRAELEARGRWPLFVQGEGVKAALVESFRRTPEAVLLGTASFWHGVDVPGEALSLVVVDKLPFDVPADPLVAARIARIRSNGGNPFLEYQVPMAVLELKQGLGRLIRARADRGIVAVLDPRLVTKRYGAIFLRSLPPYRVVRTIEDCAAFFRGSGLTFQRRDAEGGLHLGDRDRDVEM